MEIPLWYKVARRELSYSHFEERFHSHVFSDKENVRLFIWSTLFNHSPYVEGAHIICRLASGTEVDQKVLNYVYLYTVFSKNSETDMIVEGTNRRLSQLQFLVPPHFEVLLKDLLILVLRSFFNLGLIQLPLEIYEPGNQGHLKKVLEYLEIHGSRYCIQNKTAASLYQIAQLHDMLVQFRNFLQGYSYPDYLKVYRRDVSFYRDIMKNHSPDLISGLLKGGPIEGEELEFLQSEQEQLCERGNIEFLFHYIEMMKAIFDNSSFTERLTRKTSSDQELANKVLRVLSSSQRAKYLLQSAPVSERQLDKFLHEIAEHGIEAVLKARIEMNKHRFEAEIKQTGSKLASEMILIHESIYLYRPEDFIWHTEGDMLFLFLFNEIIKLEGQNPYTKVELPDYSKLGLGRTSDSIETLWTDLLRRKIELSL